MAPVVSALFLFNSRFEPNVPVLDKLYRERFSRRKYIMPFATKRQDNVIPVREVGWYFSGHLAQAADAFIEPDVTHYVVISDDLFVNPAIDEHNLLDKLAISEQSAWITSLAVTEALRNSWEWAADAAYHFRRMSATDAFRLLPPPADALERYRRLGLAPAGSPMPRSAADLRFAFGTLPRNSRAIFLESLSMLGKPSPFPSLAGYSDFLVVPANAIREFTFWCGVLAALNIFAEIAVPTALALSCDAIATELILGDHFAHPAARRRTDAPLKGQILDFAGTEAFGESRGWSRRRLTDEFPEDWLYVHPIKFSRWK
jgi:hypothetical protein